MDLNVQTIFSSDYFFCFYSSIEIRLSLSFREQQCWSEAGL